MRVGGAESGFAFGMRFGLGLVLGLGVLGDGLIEW